MDDIERLKSNTRHSWTSSGRQESVAEHSWRMSVMAMVIGDEFPDVDISRVVEICLIHDLGEVYDGDIPSFNKKKEDEKKEEIYLAKVVKPLPNKMQNKISNLWKEFEDCETPEARLAKALDKLEALIQHNEADISTWLPLEYELNLTYGQEYCRYNSFIKLFRKIVNEVTKGKIKNSLKQKK